MYILTPSLGGIWPCRVAHGCRLPSGESYCTCPCSRRRVRRPVLTSAIPCHHDAQPRTGECTDALKCKIICVCVCMYKSYVYMYTGCMYTTHKNGKRIKKCFFYQDSLLPIKRALTEISPYTIYVHIRSSISAS